jgi:hypothetical protein
LVNYLSFDFCSIIMFRIVYVYYECYRSLYFLFIFTCFSCNISWRKSHMRLMYDLKVNQCRVIEKQREFDIK